MFSLLETFLSIYETQSFTRTGNYLFISQPTVTLRIKKLEEELGSPLFLRGRHQEVIPTESAHFLYGRVQQLLKEWEQTQEALKQQISIRHSFKIGISQSVATSIMPALFNIFIPDLSQLDLEISVFNSEKVFDLVKNHEIHFGIIEKPMMSAQTETFSLCKDELVIAGDSESDLFFIRENDSGVGYYTQLYLKEQNKFPKHIVKINSNDVIVAHLKAGLGTSLISKRFVNSELPYQVLGEKYQRKFLGVSFLNEGDYFIKDLIQKIKNFSNIEKSLF